MKTTSKKNKKKWRRPKKKMKKNEDNLNIFFLNGRRPQKKWRRPQQKWRRPQKNEKNEDDLKKIKNKNEDDLKKKIFSWFLLNLGANLSWGWLSSLRFFSILSWTQILHYRLYKCILAENLIMLVENNWSLKLFSDLRPDGPPWWGEGQEWG